MAFESAKLGRTGAKCGETGGEVGVSFGRSSQQRNGRSSCQRADNARKKGLSLRFRAVSRLWKKGQNSAAARQFSAPTGPRPSRALCSQTAASSKKTSVYIEQFPPQVCFNINHTSVCYCGSSSQNLSSGSAKAYLKAAGAALSCALLLAFPGPALEAALEAMELWARAFAPALFPFFAVTPALCCPEAAALYERALGRVMEALFGCPGRAAAPLAVGLMAGSPAGAAALSRVKDSMTGAQATRALLLSAGLSPAFLVSSLGGAMLGNPALGAVLLRSQIGAVLLGGLLLKRAFGGRQEPICGDSPAVQRQTPPLRGAVLGGAYGVRVDGDLWGAEPVHRPGVPRIGPGAAALSGDHRRVLANRRLSPAGADPIGPAGLFLRHGRLGGIPAKCHPGSPGEKAPLGAGQAAPRGAERLAGLGPNRPSSAFLARLYPCRRPGPGLRLAHSRRPWGSGRPPGQALTQSQAAKAGSLPKCRTAARGAGRRPLPQFLDFGSFALVRRRYSIESGSEGPSSPLGAAVFRARGGLEAPLAEGACSASRVKQDTSKALRTMYSPLSNNFWYSLD